jgi:GT2 family glycosyltransferase
MQRHLTVAKGGTHYPKQLKDGTLATKLIQRALFFRSWYVDRPVIVLSSVDPTVEDAALALSNRQVTPEGAVGLALHLADENAFYKLIGNVDLRMSALILGGAVDVAELLAAFPHRRVRGFKHAKSFPHGLELCDDQDAELAVVGELPMPEWPRIGLTMPVVENAAGARRTALRLLATYPGDLNIAIVANGSSDVTLNDLLALEGEGCERLWVVRETQNLGFPGGANAGLQELWTDGWYDLFGTVHDDLVPSLCAISELADAIETLRKLGQRPGVIGPATNRADGPQGIALPSYASVDEFEERSADQFSACRRSADEVERVGSHLMLLDAEALSEVGGFDLAFGRGFFSDDDWCLRARLMGYRIWVAYGAYVHHECGLTFNFLSADEETTISRNQALFAEKWRNGQRPERGQELHLPLARRRAEPEFAASIYGEQVDLIHQASAIEFAAFVNHQLEDLPREARAEVLKALRVAADKASSVNIPSA